MDQNKMKCIQCMDKIKRNLDKLGYSNIMTSDKMNILCKVNPDDLDKNNSNIKGSTSSSFGIPTCQHANTGKCPYTVCKYPNATCNYHHHNNIGNNGDSTTEGNPNSDSLSGLLEVSNTYHESLFRLMPNDIDTGIFLHAIKLHGETCDLKMTFGYDDIDITEIIRVIKFLV